MKKNKLTEILGVLTKSELKKFRQFLSASFLHKPSVNLTRATELLNYIATFYPNFTNSALDKNIICKQLFPGTPLNISKLEKLMTYLTKQLTYFIQLQQVLNEQDDLRREIYLERFYKERKLESLFQLSVKRIRKIQQQRKYKLDEEYYTDFLFESTLSNMAAEHSSRGIDLNLPNTLKALDEFYLLNRLKYSCHLLAEYTFHSNMNLEVPLEIFEPPTVIVKKLNLEDNRLIHIYTLVFEIFRSDPSDIEPYKDQLLNLEQNISAAYVNLSKDQLQTFHAYLRSFWIVLINLGENKYLKKGFELYKAHLQDETILMKNGLHYANFKNIVSFGLKLKSYDWVFDFLKKYKDNITGAEHPEDIYNYNLANYYYYTNQIEDAEKLLSQHYIDVYNKIAAKRLEIKILYTKGSEQLDNKINAFKIFVHRISKKNLPEAHRESNNNFVNVLLQIIAPINQSMLKRNRIRKKVEENPKLFEKQWLLSLFE